MRVAKAIERTREVEGRLEVFGRVEEVFETIIVLYK